MQAAKLCSKTPPTICAAGGGGRKTKKTKNVNQIMDLLSLSTLQVINVKTHWQKRLADKQLLFTF